MSKRFPGLSVTDLANYAADPQAFRRHGHRVRSKAAVRAGDRGHERVGARGQTGWPRRLLLIAIVCALTALGWFLTR